MKISVSFILKAVALVSLLAFGFTQLAAHVGVPAAAGLYLALNFAAFQLQGGFSACLGANGGISTLVPLVTQAFDVVSRELVGFIPSVNRDSNADRLAANQTLYSWVAPAITLQNVTPAAASPSAGDRTLGNKSISISNFKMADFYFTGEEEKMLNASGGNYGNVVTDTIEQCIRTICNQIETDLWTAGYVGASRGYGTAGTTPFGSNVGESAQMRKILDDNGAPMGTRSLIIDTTAGASLRTLANLSKVNEAGTEMTLRDGQLLNLNGFMIKESAAIGAVTKGTGASYLINNGSGYAIGSTTLALDTGSGTILAGDMITIGSDTNKYVVTSGLSGGSLTIAAPGLRVAAADNAAVTVVNTSTRNLAFSRNAMLLATRLCAVPSGGDIARDRVVITDARSGISVELAEYPQYRQVRYEISAAWGVSVNKAEHLAVLLG